MGTARWAVRANKVIKHYASKVDKLSGLLQAGQSERIETNRRRFKILESHKKIRVLFEKWLCPDRHDAHLVSIGSTISGLAYREGSDVDFTYVPRPDILKDIHSTLDNRQHFVNILKERVEELAKEEPEWTLAQPVIVPKRTARIPILTAKFTNGCSVDVQLPSTNLQSIRNTNLMKQYVSADPRFRTLYFWLRSLFDSLGALQPKRQLLSSYRAALLCLHFLQTREIDPNVLPIMHLQYIHLVNARLPLERVEELLEAPHKPRLSGWSSKNRKSVGELAVELVHYYADFDPRREAISIRNGQRYKRLDHERNSESLLIFDPYSTFPASASEYLQDLFAALFPFLRKCLENGYLIDSFPYVEEARVFRKRFIGRSWSHFLDEMADNETLPPGWRVEIGEGIQRTEVETTKRRGRRKKKMAKPTTEEVFPPGEGDVSMGCYAYAASLPVDSLLRGEGEE